MARKVGTVAGLQAGPARTLKPPSLPTAYGHGLRCHEARQEEKKLPTQQSLSGG